MPAKAPWLSEKRRERAPSPSDVAIGQESDQVFELVVNTKDAKAIEVTMPSSILVRADEGIE